MKKNRMKALAASWMFFFASGEGFAVDSEVQVESASQAAPSAQTASSPTSSTASTSLFDRASEYFTLNYYGTYRGAPLSSFGNSLQPAADGKLDPKNPLSLENQITASYRLNQDVAAGIQAHFFYYPVGKPAGSGQGLENLDPVLIVNWSNLVQKGGFKLNGRFTADLPLTGVDFLQKNKLMTGLALYGIASYAVPETPLTLGLYSYVKGYVPTADTPLGAMTYRLYACPNANYQLRNNLSVSLWVDLLQLSRTSGTGFVSGLKNEMVDIEPGISWDITKNIAFNPFLNIYPSNFTLSATSIQANISAKAL